MMSASYHELTYAFYTPDQVSGANQNTLFDASATGMDGNGWRFLLCLNAMINYPHFVIQKESPKVYQQRMIHGRRMPRNELNVLSWSYQSLVVSLTTPRSLPMLVRQNVGTNVVVTIGISS